jgi:hypothetical protein
LAGEAGVCGEFLLDRRGEIGVAGRGGYGLFAAGDDKGSGGEQKCGAAKGRVFHGESSSVKGVIWGRQRAIPCESRLPPAAVEWGWARRE